MINRSNMHLKNKSHYFWTGALLALCAGNSQVNFPHKGQWNGALMFPLIRAWITGWVNNRDADNLRRHCAHYYVTLMPWQTAMDFSIIEINPLPAKFFRENINIYLHFVSYLHIDTTQVVEILPQIRQEPAYSTQSISWLLMSWRRKEPGHHQPWYWSSETEITRSPHVKG